MKRVFAYLMLVCLCGLLVGVISPAKAQTAAPTPAPTAPPKPTRVVSDDEVNAVSRNLYCPVCQNTPLEVCPTEACARWREQVRDLLAEGKTEEEVRQYFIEKFGMRTVGAPVDPFGRVLTVGVPFVLVLLVGGYLALRIQRRQRTPTSEPDKADEPDIAPDDYAARLEAELKARK